MLLKNRDTRYPRPTLVRGDWMTLDGEWQFAFDDENRGLREKWFQGELPLRIRVPFCYQSGKSGIGDVTAHDCVWYRRTFALPDACRDRRILLHFGAVDYACTVYVNQMVVMQHTGGHVPFSADITDWLTPGENSLCLRVTDTAALDQPRGKQCPAERIDRCWYTPTTGIWRSVWLEPVADAYVESLTLTPSRKDQTVKMKFALRGKTENASLSVRVSYEEATVCETTVACLSNGADVVLPIEPPDYVDDVHCWSPEHPVLFSVTASLRQGGQETDRVESYFGMRDIEVRNGTVLLNGQPFYQKLVLNQGYWRDTLLTPPDGDALLNDLLTIKKMGFNGVRMHQKIEDERFYAFADTIGLAVWAEMPSSYVFTHAAMRRTIREWIDAVTSLRNHPSILVWVPLNESWGVRNILHDPAQQQYACALYALTKALDPGRLVSTNDGWEQVTSDLCSIHDYFPNAESFERRYADLNALLARDAEGRMLYAQGYAYASQPVILSEFGGISFGTERSGNAWGYNEHATDRDAYLTALARMVQCVRRHPRMQGYCYTQFTDVMQETNGLLDMEHQPKADLESYRAIFCLGDEKPLSGYAKD